MAAQKDFWRDEGYPGFSKWMASSDDFLVLRRFGQLNVRVLLLMQDRIVRKEEELANIDAHGRLHGDDSKADSSSLRKEPLPEREAILDELKTMLHEYNEYILAFSQIKGWRSAQDRQVENIENWFYNHPYAIDSKEQEFAKSNQTQSGTTLYFSNTRFDAFVTFTVIAAGLMLLLGPMWWLQFVADPVKRLGIITGFVLLFTGLLASATVAKPFEVMAAAAAYTAVLMVFLQIGGSTSK
ncbi:hypothetical protein ACCO45_002790 [Purpureocillium lilacinum]|uniref:Uncharacterized protein n=1 Tax=Purpureocillium lilacinum TaxID=33203 RepID=A0ACC4DY30_PURLI